MIFKDYYKILGLETSRVSIDEIKTAYRQSAKKYHPDVNVGDVLAEERIKDINEAYRILSVPSTKRKYDRTWNAKFYKEQRNLRGKESIFGILLGNIEKNQDTQENKSKENPIKGENIETKISISLYDAYYGIEKRISLKDVNGKVKNLAVAVPKGIREGEKIRLIGQGKPGKNGGKNGDLLIEIHIEQDKKYRLEGYDLYTDLCLTPWEAALGTRIEVKSIDDLTKVYIPQGIESGEFIRIPGKGYYNGQGGRGDLVAEVKIMIPKKLSEKEKNIYEELKKVSEFNPRSDLHK